MLGKKPTTCSQKRLEGSSRQRCEKETFWEGVPCPRLAQGPPLKKPAAKAKGGPDLIHQPSLKLGGGKNQSYIQHMPDGPGTSLRLIIACTAARAKFLKISHKALMEELLPKCKEKGATESLQKGKNCTKNMTKAACSSVQELAASLVQGLTASLVQGLWFVDLWPCCKMMHAAWGR